MTPDPQQATGADGGAGARIAGAEGAAGARFIVPSDDTGGTAITVVLLGAGGVGAAVAMGATPPGILIVGMPMIVAERGG